MGKLIVEIPDEIHGALKRKALADHKTLKEIVTKLIQEYLTVPPSKKSKTKESGLCGIWEDDRSAEEIIKDIKSNRRWFTRRGR